MMMTSRALILSIFLILATLELSFTESTALNLYVFASCLIFLSYQRKWKAVIACFLIPILPALATYWSIHLQGMRPELALVLLTRTFTFSSLGLVGTFGIDLEELLLTLEQKGLPSNFVYGLLVVIHAFQEISSELVQIREASLLRGQKLGFWSPFYYVKVIFTAYSWQEMYGWALLAHAYDEESDRRSSIIYRQDTKVILILVFMAIVGQICLIV